MPELPELYLSAKFINDISCTVPYTHVEIPANSKINCDFSNLPPLFMLDAKSRGKELIINISNYKDKLKLTMGMSGTWMYLDRKALLFYGDRFEKHIRLAFNTPSGGKLFLYDIRRFAKWKWDNNWSKNRGFDPVFEYEKFCEVILNNYGSKDFEKPLCEILLNQKYFNGIGNYLRSTICFYLDINPFQSLNSVLENQKIFDLLKLCKEVPKVMIDKGGGQLKDWTNPWGIVNDIKNYIYYNKGFSCKDNSGRTFWFNPKWEIYCPYKIKTTKK